MLRPMSTCSTLVSIACFAANSSPYQECLTAQRSTALVTELSTTSRPMCNSHGASLAANSTVQLAWHAALKCKLHGILTGIIPSGLRHAMPCSA